MSASQVYFNSHPHKEDDVISAFHRVATNHFNSHPHKEDDIVVSYTSCKIHISTHILTRRMTVCLNHRQKRRNFNSHPHKEDDRTSQKSNALSTVISTHILTRRMTAQKQAVRAVIFISTHILTRRMTSYSSNLDCPGANFNSHPHKEDDSNFKQNLFI